MLVSCLLPGCRGDNGTRGSGDLNVTPLSADTVRVGQQVTARTFSREDRQRYRRKVRSSLDVFARMLSEARFHPEQRSFGLEIELNLTDDHGDPALVNAAALEAIADAGVPDRAGAVQCRDQHPAASARGPGVLRARARCARQPQQRRGAFAHGRRAHDADRDPADDRPTAPQRGVVQLQSSLPAAERADLRGARGGPRDLDRRAWSAWRSTPTRSLPRLPAPASSCISRSSPTGSPRTGTRRRRSPGSRSRSRRTRRSSMARSCGARRASPCSNRPPTRARRS